MYYLRSEITTLDDFKKPEISDSNEDKWVRLSKAINYAIDYELGRNPNLIKEPENLQQKVFRNPAVKENMKNINCAISYAKRTLSERKLLDARLKAKGGRGKTVPK